MPSTARASRAPAPSARRRAGARTLHAVPPSPLAVGRRASPRPTGGWLALAGWTSSAPITALTASWVVPPPPTARRGAVLFLSAGLQSAEDAPVPHLLQAALQWGSDGERGGPWWGLSCWYQFGMAGAVPRVTTSDYERVAPGDRVTATLSLAVLRGIPAWTVAIRARGARSAEASLTVTGEAPLHWACLGLEGYGRAVEARDLPRGGGAAFTGIAVDAGGRTRVPAWTPEPMPGAQARAEVRSPRAVRVCW